ncbi:C-factor [Chlamydiales bacterium SCGC AG-110-P3]|nr:C-factor [Chlamydiales bacterium SCGC AG-110-P3]
MPRVLITGSNRGLGLEFVRQYLDRGWIVEACCRRPDKATVLYELQEKMPDALSIHRLDVGDNAAVDQLAEKLILYPVDVLINNAGIYRGSGLQPGQLNYDEWDDSFRINTMAPIKITEAFLPCLEAGNMRCVVNISSRMGSIADNTSGGSYAYRTSKAALNAAIKCMSIDLKDRGITIIALHPGWVATDMGGSSAPLRVPESVTKMLEVIGGLTIADTGRFLAFDGEELSW